MVQDKLFLPGLRKLKLLRDAGFFGRILSVRGEFGYWVFEGDWQPAQRPSWNYRKADGGGIILDMLCHWRYVLDNLFGEVRGGDLPRRHPYPQARRRERQAPTTADADDAAYATFELEGGVIAQINSSWDVRVRRDDLVTFQVDGTHGSAVAGLDRTASPSRASTRRARCGTRTCRRPWTSSRNGRKCRTTTLYDNGFKIAVGGFHPPCRWPIRRGTSDLIEGAKGVQLAELGLQELGRAALASMCRN